MFQIVDYTTENAEYSVKELLVPRFNSKGW